MAIACGGVPPPPQASSRTRKLKPRSATSESPQANLLPHRKGKKWGDSKNGWRWKVTDDQLAAIHKMQAARKKIAQISRIVGLSRPTIYRILKAI